MDPFYRRLFWALGAFALCVLVAWITWKGGQRSEDREDTDLPPLGKRERLVLTEAIQFGLTGSVSYRGSVWSARNESGQDLNVGEVVFIERVHSSHTLVITAAGDGVVGS